MGLSIGISGVKYGSKWLGGGGGSHGVGEESERGEGGGLVWELEVGG